MMNKYATITIDIKGVVFLCLIIGFLVGAESVTASLVSTERDPFFIGKDMRDKKGRFITIAEFCSIEECEGKFYAKGLCQKHYYQKNKERIKQYYLDNKEKIAKREKQYRQENKDKIAKKDERYRTDNKEHIKQYREEHKEEKAKRIKRWRQTPIGKAISKTLDHNRRTLTKDLTKATIQRVYEANITKYGTLTCSLCLKPIIDNDDSLEHSTPLSRGGSNDYENLGVAHLNCNKQKHTMTLKEWFKLAKKTN